MKLKYLLIALLAILSAAPDIYLPWVELGCPTAEIGHISSLSFFTPRVPASQLGSIFLRGLREENTEQFLAYNAETGVPLPIYWSDMDYYYPSSMDTIYFSFWIPDCDIYDNPYKLRFDVTLVGGCTYSLTWEYVPQCFDDWDPVCCPSD